MSFHIDIVSIIGVNGASDLVEVDYTIDDCIKRGWMSTDGIWLREEIDVRALCEDGERPEGPDRIPDPSRGQDQNLKLVECDGRWVADMGGGMLFK